MSQDLHREVPSDVLCFEMDSIPALREAFKDSPFVFWKPLAGFSTIPGCNGALSLRTVATKCRQISAPTVRAMLAYLADNDNSIESICLALTVGDRCMITDPDAIARVCIEASR